MEGYYSIQTNEGETIKKLLAEYIDIILIRSRNVDSKGIEGDEGAIMLEDRVTSGRALPFVVDSLENGSQRFVNAFQPPKSVDIKKSPPQQQFTENSEQQTTTGV